MKQTSLFGDEPESLPSSDAILSPCKKYRYTLTRRWNLNPDLPDEGMINWIMLNPSTADASQDDPTITRCIKRSKSLGFSSLVVTNLFAWRATDPRDMIGVEYPVGPENNQHIQEIASQASCVVFGWGANGGYLLRDREIDSRIRAMGINPHCLGITNDRFPSHPLYIPGVQPLVPYPPRPDKRGIR